MCRFKGIYVALALFGAIHLVDASFRFGIDEVCLPPFQTFLFSLWILVRNVVGFTLLMSAPVLILGKYSRILLVPAYCYFVAIEAVSRCSEKMFSLELSTAWLQLLQNSSVGEIVGFIRMSMTPWFVLGVVMLLMVAVTGSVLLWRARYPRPSRRSVLTGVVFCVPLFVTNFLLAGWQGASWKYALNQMMYTQFIHGTLLSIRETSGANQACCNPSLPAELSVGVAEGEQPDGVFVIGESSTRNNWHLYGYPRETTPCMDALYEKGEIVKFDDVVGVHPLTTGALSLLLTDMRIEDMRHGGWTLPEVYRRAGYRCVLISNQYSWGNTNSLMYKVFNGCEKRMSPRGEFGEDGYDGRLTEILEKEMRSGDGRPTIAFLHLAGIHYPVEPSRVHPPEYTHFTDKVDAEFMKRFPAAIRDRLNRYDDGVLYEDKVLDMVIDVMRKRERPSFMFFMSDHGESPRAQIWRSCEDEDIYEIPVLFWFSDGYIEKFAETVKRIRNAACKRMQPDEMTYGLLELGFIQGLAPPHGCMSFLDENFAGRYPRLIYKGKMRYSKDCSGP